MLGSFPVGINPVALAADSKGNILVSVTGGFAAPNGAVVKLDAQLQWQDVHRTSDAGVGGP